MDITVLNLRGTGAFADYFLLCSGTASRRSSHRRSASKNGSDAQGRHVAHREGKSSAEWVLLDYGYFVVHIFSERARQYYDLERLWRNAERIDFHEPVNPARPQRSGAAKSPAVRTTSLAASPKATSRSNDRVIQFAPQPNPAVRFVLWHSTRVLFACFEDLRNCGAER